MGQNCDLCGKKDATTFRYAEDGGAYYESSPDGTRIETDGGRVYACGTRHLHAYLKEHLAELRTGADGSWKLSPLTSSELQEVVIWEDHEQ
jgi:hypothetical protein